MLVPILRAAHCRSTHHFFAIDAIERIGTERGRRLGEMLLKYYSVYLRGAKDPDDKFKDFQNHVLHVGDKHWGGAPRACEEWLAKAQTLLASGDWSAAAYACGVLSHYFTDPIMPLHTGQSDAETVVHRPMEWSICKAYDEIYTLCQFGRARIQLSFDQQPGWISRAVTEAATHAHGHYTRLIEIYNLPRGTVDPPRGLTKEARQILSELFDLAVGGWASILMRIASDLGAPLPDCSLTMSTLIAGIDCPRALIVRKFTDASERTAVQRIFEEYSATGRLEDNLPAECKVVRQELAKRERESKQRNSSAAVEQRADEPLEVEFAVKPVAANSMPLPPTLPMPMPMPGLGPLDEPSDEEPLPTGRPKRRPEPPPPAVEFEEQIEVDADDDDDDDDDDIVGEEETIQRRPTLTSSLAQRDSSEDYDDAGLGLSWQSALVDAPSIGPKTAKRFEAIGIRTIAQFLAADVNEMASQLQTSWIKPELLEDWQAQARLVCEVPALSGYKAQLLVAVGCRTSEDLRDADANALYHAIHEFATTKEAQRILRSTAAPDLAEVTRWCHRSALRK